MAAYASQSSLEPRVKTNPSVRYFRTSLGVNLGYLKLYVLTELEPPSIWPRGKLMFRPLNPTWFVVVKFQSYGVLGIKKLWSSGTMEFVTLMLLYSDNDDQALL